MTSLPALSSPAANGPAALPAAALVAADRWSLWCTVSRGLAHHLANAAQMLAIDPPPARARAEAVERITLVHQRLAEVQPAIRPAPALVPEALADVQALQRLQSGFASVELELDAAPELPAVALAAADLRHVLLALVTNAKQAANGERARIRIAATAVPGGAEIVVDDDGPGVPADAHERVFEPFVTTRGGGALGIGLTAARALAHSAGGTLAVEPGTSRFRLFVPAWARPIR